MKERVMVDSNGRKYITTEPELKNNFNPDWDAMAVMVEEQQRITKRIEELTQRKWVGLTDEEYFGLQMKIKTPMISVGDYIDAMRMVEKKLKEKNGF